MFGRDRRPKGLIITWGSIRCEGLIWRSRVAPKPKNSRSGHCYTLIFQHPVRTDNPRLKCHRVRKVKTIPMPRRRTSPVPPAGGNLRTESVTRLPEPVTILRDNEHVLGIRPSKLAVRSSNRCGCGRDRFSWVLRDTKLGAAGSRPRSFA